MSPEADRLLTKIVVARTVFGRFQAVGRCIAYCNAPMVEIMLPNGKQVHWRADMVEALDIPDDVANALLPKS